MLCQFWRRWRGSALVGLTLEGPNPPIPRRSRNLLRPPLRRYLLLSLLSSLLSSLEVVATGRSRATFVVKWLNLCHSIYVPMCRGMDLARLNPCDGASLHRSRSVGRRKERVTFGLSGNARSPSVAAGRSAAWTIIFDGCTISPKAVLRSSMA